MYFRNPIYAGEFLWKGKRYKGHHEPIISMSLFEQVQEVFEGANRPKYTKRQHAFTGLVTCGRCGCALTAEIKKGRYVYYHCTGGRGACGNTYVREEELSRLFADVVKRVQVPVDVADWIAEALRESQDDKERFHRTAVMQLQQQYLAVQVKLDRAYDDRLAARITDELWVRKSGEWEAELASVRRETARHERASRDYAPTGSKILELAKNAHNLFIRQDPREQARLLKTLVSNSTFDRGTLSVAYVKPFDLLVEGNETENWLGGRESANARCRCSRPFAEFRELLQTVTVIRVRALRLFAGCGWCRRPLPPRCHSKCHSRRAPWCENGTRSCPSRTSAFRVSNSPISVAGGR